MHCQGSKEEQPFFERAGERICKGRKQDSIHGPKFPPSAPLSTRDSPHLSLFLPPQPNSCAEGWRVWEKPMGSQAVVVGCCDSTKTRSLTGGERKAALNCTETASWWADKPVARRSCCAAINAVSESFFSFSAASIFAGDLNIGRVRIHHRYL